MHPRSEQCFPTIGVVILVRSQVNHGPPEQYTPQPSVTLLKYYFIDQGTTEYPMLTPYLTIPGAVIINNSNFTWLISCALFACGALLPLQRCFDVPYAL